MVVDMDFAEINVWISLLSGAMMLAAIVYMLTYMLGSFSSKSGAQSLKVVFFSLLYFFGSVAPLWMGVEWLMEVARARAARGTEAFSLNIGASALALNAVLHIFCGFLTIGLYLKGLRSQGLTLERVLNDIRFRMRSKSKK